MTSTSPDHRPPLRIRGLSVLEKDLLFSEEACENKRSFCPGETLAELGARHGHMTKHGEGTLNLAEQEECGWWKPPGGSVVWTLSFHCRWHRFYPWWGN